MTGPFVPVAMLNLIRAVLGIHHHRFNLSVKRSSAQWKGHRDGSHHGRSSTRGFREGAERHRKWLVLHARDWRDQNASCREHTTAGCDESDLRLRGWPPDSQQGICRLLRSLDRQAEDDGRATSGLAIGKRKATCPCTTAGGARHLRPARTLKREGLTWVQNAMYRRIDVPQQFRSANPAGPESAPGQGRRCGRHRLMTAVPSTAEEAARCWYGRRGGHAAYCANKSNWRRSQSMQIPPTIQPRRERTGRRITQRLATPALSDYVPGCRNTTTEPK